MSKEKTDKTPDKYEQGWCIREIKRFISLAITADQSLQFKCIKKIEEVSLDSWTFFSNLCNFQTEKSLVN